MSSKGSSSPAYVSDGPDLTTGDVTGPAGAVDDNLAAFDGATGKLLKDSGIDKDDVVQLGGQIGGTGPSPDIRGVRETGGPTLLTMGAVADGEVLTRSGATIIGSAGGGATPAYYISGCPVTRISTTQLTIGLGLVRSDDDTEDMEVTALLTNTIANTGANGRNVDTAEQANKWYAVYVIKNVGTGTVASFLINEDDLGSFTFPAGYTKKRRVGWIRNNPSSNLRDGTYFGFGGYRKYLYSVPDSFLQALTSGSATSWTDVDLSEWVPPTSQGSVLNAMFDGFGSGNQEGRTRKNGYTGSSSGKFVLSNTNPDNVVYEQATDNSQLIEYEVDGASDNLDLFVIGFIDEV